MGQDNSTGRGLIKYGILYLVLIALISAHCTGCSGSDKSGDDYGARSKKTGSNNDISDRIFTEIKKRLPLKDYEYISLNWERMSKDYSDSLRVFLKDNLITIIKDNRLFLADDMMKKLNITDQYTRKLIDSITTVRNDIIIAENTYRQEFRLPLLEDEYKDILKMMEDAGSKIKEFGYYLNQISEDKEERISRFLILQGFDFSDSFRDGYRTRTYSRTFDYKEKPGMSYEIRIYLWYSYTGSDYHYKAVKDFNYPGWSWTIDSWSFEDKNGNLQWYSRQN